MNRRGAVPKWKTPELLAAIQERYDGTSATIDALVAEFKVPRYSIRNYAKDLGLSRKKESNWSEKEVQFLIDNWSEKGLEYCAKRLKRSKIGVKLKAKRLGLGGIAAGSRYMTGQNVADLLGIDIHVVLRWIKTGKLAFKYAPFDNRVMHFIDLEDLEQFLKNNLNLWDSRKMKGSLWLQDPDWLVEKKAADRSRPKNEGKKWTKDEDKRAIALFKTGNYTYQQIGSVLGRSRDSVERRISRLDVWGSGEFVGDKR